MSLPASQRRALVQIEQSLADDHPGLGPLFAVFTSLAGQQAMPATERVTVRPWRPWRPARPRRPASRRRRMRPGVAAIALLAVATGALLFLSLTLAAPRMCASGTVASVAAQARSVPGGRQPACTTQQNKPSNTSQSGLSH
jgi:Protein of unknown function (DUF3040)